ncbi:MAG: HEAT repeat domain-containing protein [Gammaproteobacteria bacterium]
MPIFSLHLPVLLTADLYPDDGQMQDEVYNYGSFLQSKMHAQGVSCSDCHEPHILKLRAGDTPQPVIARATVLSELAPWLSPARFATLNRGLDDPDPLVRIGVLQALVDLLRKRGDESGAVNYARPFACPPINSIHE